MYRRSPIESFEINSDRSLILVLPDPNSFFVRWGAPRLLFALEEGSLDCDCSEPLSESAVISFQLVFQKALHYLLLSVPVLNQVHLDTTQGFEEIFLI